MPVADRQPRLSRLLVVGGQEWAHHPTSSGGDGEGRHGVWRASSAAHWRQRMHLRRLHAA